MMARSTGVMAGIANALSSDENVGGMRLKNPFDPSGADYGFTEEYRQKHPYKFLTYSSLPALIGGLNYANPSWKNPVGWVDDIAESATLLKGSPRYKRELRNVTYALIPEHNRIVAKTGKGTPIMQPWSEAVTALSNWHL